LILKKKGIFIVFEGIDGSGKSTQIQLLAAFVKGLGRKVYTTFEPTDGPVGLLIRKMLSGKLSCDQRTIASLFAADRTDHLLDKTCGIRRKVDQGEVVLSDRYYFSSYAYHARDVDMDWIIHSNSINADILRPDLTVFIDVDPDVCLRRIEKNRSQLEIYEKIDILKQVRTNYFKAFEKLRHEEHIVVIDGNGPVEAVQERIRQAVAGLIHPEDGSERTGQQ
jgi:dTMP kinase